MNINKCTIDRRVSVIHQKEGYGAYSFIALACEYFQLHTHTDSGTICRDTQASEKKQSFWGKPKIKKEKV